MHGVALEMDVGPGKEASLSKNVAGESVHLCIRQRQMHRALRLVVRRFEQVARDNVQAAICSRIVRVSLDEVRRGTV